MYMPGIRYKLLFCLGLYFIHGCEGGGRPHIDDDNPAEAAQAEELINQNSEDQEATGVLQVIGLPDGRTDNTEFNVTVSSTNFDQFSYKFGPAEQILCSESGGYSTPRPITEMLSITTEVFADGYIKLCLLGVRGAGQRQSLSQAMQAVWIKETVAASPEEIQEATISNEAQIPLPPNVLSNNPYVINCNQEAVTKSINSLVPRALIIANPAKNDGTDQVYRIHWLNYAGARVLYTDINPGFQVQIETFETHPWLISDLAGNCKGIYVTIQDDIFLIDLK
ncbi:MAG: hypothetical protein ACOH5I_22380 [Oligoflexus sp.]